MGKTRLLPIFSVLYLALPVCLWLYGWVEPWLAWPLMAGALWCTCVSTGVQNGGKRSVTRNLLAACPFIVLAMGAVFLCGLDGRLPQSYDLYMRNPLYQTLIDTEWPTLFPDGRNMLYPLQFWLPPALLSKITPANATEMLQLWCALGIVLALLNFRQELGTRKTIPLFVVLVLFCGLTKFVDDFLNVILHIDAIYGVHMRMPGVFSQLVNTYHYFVLTLLVASMVYNTKMSKRPVVFGAALFAAMNPIAASLVLPVLIWRMQKGGTTFANRICMVFSAIKMPESWVGMVLAVISLAYYSSAQTSEFRYIFHAPYAPPCNLQSILILASAILLTSLPLIWLGVKSKTGYLVALAGCFAFILIYQYGGPNGSNEWLYKTAIIYGIAVLHAVSLLPRRGYLSWMAIIMAVSMLPFLREFQYKKLPEAVVDGFAVHPEYIKDDWKGTFYHPEIYDYWYFTTDTLKAPFLFKKPVATVPQEEPITTPLPE